MIGKSCNNCAFGDENCIRTRGSCFNYDKWKHESIPSSTDDCENRYPDTNDIPEGTCEKCGLNRTGGTCGYHPKKKESIIIVGSRYYQPPQDEGQIEQIVPFPVLVEE